MIQVEAEGGGIECQAVGEEMEGGDEYGGGNSR